MICHFYASTLQQWVVVEVDVRALVEAVMWGLVRGQSEVIMRICEAAPYVSYTSVITIKT